jgi:MFS family permease
MANPYKEIFSVPGTKGFSAAGFLARLPIAMASQTRGEYWLAGAVSATFALTNALISPQVSRLVDRYGQAAVLTPATIVAVIAFLALIVAPIRAGPSGHSSSSPFSPPPCPACPPCCAPAGATFFAIARN